MSVNYGTDVQLRLIIRSEGVLEFCRHRQISSGQRRSCCGHDLLFFCAGAFRFFFAGVIAFSSVYMSPATVQLYFDLMEFVVKPFGGFVSQPVITLTLAEHAVEARAKVIAVDY